MWMFYGLTFKSDPRFGLLGSLHVLLKEDEGEETCPKRLYLES